MIVMVVGFIQKFFQKEEKVPDRELKDDSEKFTDNRKMETEKEGRTKNFDRFIQKPEVQKQIKEWMKQWKYKKRGLMALMYILWLNGDTDKKIISTAKDILSKLKGEDIFAKFLNVLKLAPEDKMR
ncbi:MAG: hypothetical protein PHU63_02120 [Candidatus ainarchaeum sp.]|nr:hypothetical protein [Candidatus ainarchaeum sp.]